jgi:plasmid stability protein
MRHLEIPNLPDDLYVRIEDQARQRGRSVTEEATDILARGLSQTKSPSMGEEALLEEIRLNREAMAKRGVFLTEADMDAANNWGRE